MQAANAEAFHLFLLSWSSTDQVAWHLHFPRTQKPRVFHYEWLLILSLTWEGDESRIESSVVFSVCKNSKLLTEVQAPDHLLAEWKKFIYFHWENFAAVLSGQFFSLKKNQLYSSTWLDVEFCLYICLHSNFLQEQIQILSPDWREEGTDSLKLS